MKKISILCGVLLGITTHVAFADATDISGKYSCNGKASINGKKFKGEMDIQKSSDKTTYNTTFTWSDGEKDIGSMKTTAKANVFIQQWNSEKEPFVTGLSRWTKTKEGFTVKFFSVNQTTGDIMKGNVTCKFSKSTSNNSTSD
ncbi:hypothetical protein [Legionella oakridgensis]|uniref:hypothetical protein n=1 Tax=Legionella oakridgensis TaxID=29423 RepID=UPI0003DE36D4|nr:hypothetical protein [Legionella oakridgensis]ETO92214.1 hypothetical protein LOR_43c06530 [Legionella oakridgensis RV-2-2007]